MDELYLARRVLLDALDALGSQRDAVVVVGAQAIYLRVGDADLAVAAYTVDGDLGIEPSLLSDTPALETLLESVKLARPTKPNVGIWKKEVLLADGTLAKVSIDLLVPDGLSTRPGKRAAPLRGHHETSARAVAGLEGTIVDFDRMPIASLEPEDARSLEVRVAGPAGLVVAKVHKIHERSGTGRQKDKDALDVLRLLRGVESQDLAERMRRLRGDDRSRIVAETAIQLLPTLFGKRGSAGIEMAVRATQGLADPAEIAASCEILTNDLLKLLG